MRTLLLTLSLLTGLSSLALAGGIEFSHASLDELLARARAEDKLVFVDAYTTWCGPCKSMAAKVFPSERVGAVYNARFVNAKIDMEKGEGPAIANRYGVAAYPTYLFINGDGELVHKGIGYIAEDDFLALAAAATGPESLGALAARYDGGERGADFVRHYAETLAGLMERERSETVISTYLDGEDDWSTPENIRLLVNSPGIPGDKRMIYLVEHLSEAEAVVGSGPLMDVLQRVLVGSYMQNKRFSEMPAPELLTEYYTRWAAPARERLTDHYRLMYLDRMGRSDEFTKAVLAYYQKYPTDDPVDLNSAAWAVYENSDDPAELTVALGWAEKSVAARPTYPSLDTLAWLYHKLGRDQEAADAARRGVRLAKESDQDPGELRTLIK